MKHLLLRRMAALILLLCLVLTGCTQPDEAAAVLHEAQPLPDGQTYGVRAAVLYDESCDMAPVEDIVDWLDQSSLLGLTTEAVALTETTDLSAYDLVIPAPALAEVPDCASLEALLEA